MSSAATVMAHAIMSAPINGKSERTDDATADAIASENTVTVPSGSFTENT